MLSFFLYVTSSIIHKTCQKWMEYYRVIELLVSEF